MFKSSVYVFLSRQGVRVFALLAGVIIARILGPSLKGVIALTLLVPSIIMQFSNLGLDVSNTFFISKKNVDFKKIFSNSITLPLLISFIFLLLFLVTLSIWKKTFLKDIPSIYVFVALPLLPLWLLTANMKGIILGEKRFKDFNIGGLIESFLLFILVALFLIFLRLGVVSVLLSYIISTSVTLAFFLFLLRKQFSLRLKLDWAVLKKQLSYGVKPYLGNLFSFLNFKVDILLIGFFLDIKSVGFYALATGLIQKARDIPSSIQTVFFPEIASKSDTESNRITINVYKTVFIMMLISGMVLLLFGRHIIILLYGSEFLPSVIPFLILIVGCVILRGNAGVLSTSLAGRGKPEYATISNFTSLMLNIILNVALIPRFGINGAAIATSISAVLNSILLFFFYLHITSTKPALFFKIKKSDITRIFQVRTSGKRSN